MRAADRKAKPLFEPYGNWQAIHQPYTMPSCFNSRPISIKSKLLPNRRNISREGSAYAKTQYLQTILWNHLLKQFTEPPSPPKQPERLAISAHILGVTPAQSIYAVASIIGMLRKAWKPSDFKQLTTAAVALGVTSEQTNIAVRSILMAMTSIREDVDLFSLTDGFRVLSPSPEQIDDALTLIGEAMFVTYPNHDSIRLEQKYWEMATTDRQLSVAVSNLVKASLAIDNNTTFSPSDELISKAVGRISHTNEQIILAESLKELTDLRDKTPTYSLILLARTISSKITVSSREQLRVAIVAAMSKARNAREASELAEALSALHPTQDETQEALRLVVSTMDAADREQISTADREPIILLAGAMHALGPTPDQSKTAVFQANWRHQGNF